jgi:hypothetical protein
MEKGLSRWMTITDNNISINIKEIVFLNIKRLNKLNDIYPSCA